MKLDLYNKKRNFAKTLEPKGIVSHQYKNLFVIQKHEASHLHYDFRLELNGVLLSWAIPKGPCLDPTIKRLAMHVEDHPVEYGHFEGLIPEGEYGAGIVMLWDEGKWISLDKNPRDAYYNGHLKFLLKAKKLNGEWNLIKLKKNANDKSWLLIKSKDEYAKPILNYDILLEKPNSVLSNFDLEEIKENHKNIWTNKEGLKKISKAKKKSTSTSKKKFKIDLPKSSMPSVIYPELATLVNKSPTGEDWIHELKFDGYRILAFKMNDHIKLMSRNNKDWTKYFSNITQAIKKLTSVNIILDGELVLLDKNNKPNFQLLQNSIGLNKPFLYYVFDLLFYHEYNLMSLPLLKRKDILKQLIKNNSGVIQFSDYIVGSGDAVFKNACELGFEGIVSKNINSIYEEKRTRQWLKIKCLKRQEFVVGGYSPPQGSRNYFGSLYLGYHDKNGKLIFCGNVGTGFNQKSLQNIYSLLKKIITPTNPFTTRPPGVTSAIWVKPQLVVEVEFSEWTSDKILRHASFKGLRRDKSAKEITLENEKKLNHVRTKNKPHLAKSKIELPFKLTHPNKILYPESKITKLDLIKYYDTIREWILPYIINRPLTLVRCPENYKDCFYQKHLNKGSPSSLFGIQTKENKKIEEYIYIKDFEGLFALVQMSTLEIHPWGSRIDDIEYPDMITIDLDPAPDVKWKKIVETAQRIKEHLLGLNLRSFVKSTGGKGLHVVIPILPEYGWDEIKNFAHVFVKFMILNYPNEYVSEMSKAKRKGKIFVDYLRNQRGATAIAAYSTRARAHAPIAVPLAWDELTNDITDTSFDIFTLPKRLNKLRKDPWKDFYNLKQSLHLDKLSQF